MHLARNVFLVFLMVCFVGGVVVWFNIGSRPKEGFTPLDHPSKCYSCEDWKDGWQGMKAKSFSAERHAVAGGHPFLAKTLRYY